MDPEALLDGLDATQRRAVTSTSMPLVILAPAGSGKTRVLTRRIAYRIATGEADPRHVLALTFTRKAASEMSERLARLGLRGDSTAGTFHAIAWGVLRTRWADHRRTEPTLLESKARILGEVAPRVPGRDLRTTIKDLATEIEWAKARMITPDIYAAEIATVARRPGIRPEVVAEAYAAYETRKQRSGVVDFDDLLALCARALEDDPTFAATQRWRFRHIYVDELQDVNPLQFRLLEAWRGQSYDVTAVGDPQQAIYGWNGADAGFLLDIHRYWPPAEVIELVCSYRSTPQILHAAARVLRGAKQPAQEIEAQRADGPPPHLAAHPTDRAEAIAVARALRLAHQPGRPWSDQAVLVRTHAQTGLLTEALRESGIPHRVRGGAAFLDRPEVRRALQSLRAAITPLGTALADLEMQQETPTEPDDDVELDPVLASLALEETKERDQAIAALLRMGRDYLRLDPMGRADGFARWLTATVQSEGDAGRSGDAVDVATFHAAKGLEWVTVHLAGVEDGYVPIAHAKTAATRAEEARLLYVAMTRAQRELRITWAEQRTFAAKVVDRRPSPLLRPIADGRSAADPAAPRPPTSATPRSEWVDELAQGRALLQAAQPGGHAGLDALHAWRDAAARAARVDPAAVLADHLLARIASIQPRDVEELGMIDGVGTLLAQRFGTAMLDALHAEGLPTPTSRS
ncbi:MAG: UvrD-helicase domain-containing protein [Acidimicrobiales bacterium]